MKTTLIALGLMMVAGATLAADTYHEGYMRKDGTYVQPHYQTAPDNTRLNNYSTQGNVNPYTGQAGNVNPYQQPQQQQYQQPSYGQYGQPQQHQQKVCTKDYFGKVTCN